MNQVEGFTLAETLVALSLVAVLAGVAAAYSVPAIAREQMRSAIYETTSFLRLARAEAISRSRECRFVLDTQSRRIEVWDGNGTSTSVDDILLRRRPLASSVVVSRPDRGPAVSLERIGDSARFQTVFNSEGIVTSGTGSVTLRGGFRFVTLTVFAAGGIELREWNGTTPEPI